MKIAMIGIGSRGDLEPFLALGQALKSRGHRIKIATHADAAELVKDSDLSFHPLPGSAAAFLAQPELIKGMRKAPKISNMRAALKKSPDTQIAAEMNAIMRQHVDHAVARANLVICGPGMQESLMVRPLAVPHIMVSWYPVTPTGAFAAPGTPDLPWGPIYRRLTHHWVNWRVLRQLRPTITAGRRLHGLKGTPGTDAPLLTFYLISSAVLPDPGWPKDTILSGPWQRSDPAADDGPSRDWWDSGSAPVVVSFGSLWNVIPPSWADPIADTIQAAGFRVIFVGGPQIRTDEDRRQCSTLDFSEALPRAHALLHHGGYGTGSSALRAGVPQIITPLFIDHPWWAKQMNRIGVAPAPLALDASGDGSGAMEKYLLRLQAGLAEVDDSMKQRAVRAAENTKHDGGVEEAVELIEQWSNDRGRE